MRRRLRRRPGRSPRAAARAASPCPARRRTACRRRCLVAIAREVRGLTVATRFFAPASRARPTTPRRSAGSISSGRRCHRTSSRYFLYSGSPSREIDRPLTPGLEIVRGDHSSTSGSWRSIRRPGSPCGPHAVLDRGDRHPRRASSSRRGSRPCRRAGSHRPPGRAHRGRPRTWARAASRRRGGSDLSS